MRSSNFEISTLETKTVKWISTFCQIRDILVYHVDLLSEGESEVSALQWLDQKEKRRLRKYHYDKPRREFVLCRSALRQVVCSFLGCRNEQLSFGANEHGKPIPLVENMPASVSVNLSHSGNHGLVGIAAQGMLGIDIEVPLQREDLDGIGQMVFTTNERSELARTIGNEKVDLFYKLWTLKEALIKALGTGFSLNPSHFEIPSELRNGAKHGMFRFPHLSHNLWSLDYLGGKEFVASIAHGRDIS